MKNALNSTDRYIVAQNVAFGRIFEAASHLRRRLAICPLAAENMAMEIAREEGTA